jgi:hypothetical protein
MPYEIEEDCVAVFSACKPDGKKIHNDCIIEGNVIRYDITTQTSAVEGIVAAEIILYGADEAILCAPRFDLVVDDRAAGTSTVSDDERNFFDAILLSESDRKESETSRKGNEVLRETNEASRASAEEIRIANENERKENESSRIAYENSRLSAEAKRVENEITRNNNEASRASAENIRVSNENERKNNESQRISGEATRVKNENDRNEAFNKLNIDLKDDGEFVTVIKTNKDGSQEEMVIAKGENVVPPVTATATGSAITIESSQAPLQNLKLYGKTEQDGTPTPTEPKELKSVGDSGSFEVGVWGKNLVNIGSARELTSNGVTLTINEDGSCTMNGTLSVANVPFNVANIKLPKGKYRVLGNTDKGKRATVYINSHSGVLYGNGEFTLETTTNLYLKIYAYQQDGTYNNLKFYPMIISEVVTDTTFEPYKAKQYITMPYTLRSVGDYKDEVDFNRGVFIPRASKFVLSSNNASITPINHTSTHAYRQYNIDVPNLNGFSWKEILCNAMPYNNKVHYGNAFGCNLHTSSLIVLGVPLSWLTPYGYVDGDTSTYITAFKSYLAEKPMTFIYPLATPIETALTETELNAYRQLYTNKGTTTILSECEDTEITYYVNKPNAQAIGSLHEQINKDYLKLQQAIISTGGSTL